MRTLSLLAASLGAAVAQNLIYPPGCSDSSSANYWKENSDPNAKCLTNVILYCPDPTASNYNAAAGKLLPLCTQSTLPPAPTMHAAENAPNAPQRLGVGALRTPDLLPRTADQLRTSLPSTPPRQQSAVLQARGPPPNTSLCRGSGRAQ